MLDVYVVWACSKVFRDRVTDCHTESFSSSFFNFFYAIQNKVNVTLSSTIVTHDSIQCHQDKVKLCQRSLILYWGYSNKKFGVLQSPGNCEQYSILCL